MLIIHVAAGRLSKASMFALVVSCYNLGVAISSALGAWLLASLSCNPRGAAMETSEFQHLWIASGVSSGLDHAIVFFSWELGDLGMAIKKQMGWFGKVSWSWNPRLAAALGHLCLV